MIEAAKQLTNAIHTSLKDDGHFENNFIDESKFKVRLYKLFVNSNIFDDIETLPDTAIEMAFNLSKEIVRENVDTTLSELIDKGMVTEVVTETGEIGYVLTEEGTLKLK